MKLLLCLIILSCVLMAMGEIDQHEKRKRSGSEIVLSPDQGIVNLQSAGELEHTPTEQERLDTIMRAFSHLPKAELELIGVDLSTPIIEGTDRAKHLFEAWDNRQREFKKVVDTLTKPAEYMAELASILRNTLHAEQEVLVETLKELESLLSDLDNARDFHTIGAWPTLVGMLDSTYGVNVRAQAAWAIGTAVKNSYDYQLWTLEMVDLSSNISTKSAVDLVGDVVEVAGNSSQAPSVDSRSTTALSLLVDILWESASRIPLDSSLGCKSEATVFSSIDENLLRRALYAIFTAARGNPEIQEALIAGTAQYNLPFKSKFLYSLDSLLGIGSGCSVTSTEVPRKIWTFVSDVMDEWAYIKGPLLSSDDLSIQEKQAIEQLSLIGERFCDARWANNLVGSIKLLLKQNKLTTLKELFDVARGDQAGDSAQELSDQEASTIRATLDSLSKVETFQRELCSLELDSIHNDLSVSDLLHHIRTSSLTDIVHKDAFEDMNSTLTYSDSSQYSLKYQE